MIDFENAIFSFLADVSRIFLKKIFLVVAVPDHQFSNVFSVNLKGNAIDGRHALHVLPPNRNDSP